MAKLTKESFIESLKEMNIKEVMELVESMKEEFGIDPSAVAVAAAAPAEAAAEKTEFNVVLKSVTGAKMEVIKAVKNATGLGLIESKKMVDSAPVTVKENVKKEEAEELKKVIEAAGGQVSLE